MKTAGQYIDFFIHDLLDYSVLIKPSENFRKINTVFDIREAIYGIIEIQDDQARMKNLKILTQFKGFS